MQINSELWDNFSVLYFQEVFTESDRKIKGLNLKIKLRRSFDKMEYQGVKNSFVFFCTIWFKVSLNFQVMV